MKKKIAILFLVITFTLVSVVISVYAWIIVPTAGVDINMKSSELFSSRLLASIGTNDIDYNDPLYDPDALAIKMTKSQINSNRSGTSFPLKLDVSVTPNVNVRVRIKLVEVWTNNNGVIITRPNAFTFTYNTTTMSAEDANGNRTYTSDVLKGTTITIPFVTTASVNYDNISNNTTVKLSVVVSTIQANRIGAWSQPIPSYSATFSAFSNATIQVIYNGVSNQEFGRGIYVEMIGVNNSNRYNFVWNARNTTIDPLTISAGQYKFYINLTNYMNFTVSYGNNKLTITITNSSLSNWGYEDVIYSPNTIAYWNSTTTYSADDIVYFDDPDEGEDDQTGYYIAVSGNNKNHRPDNNSWAWRTMALDYQNNTMYTTGTILFHNSVFYRAKKNTWSSPPAADAWERMDRMYATGNTYPTGSIVFTEDGNHNRTYFYATGAISTYQPPESWTNWKQFGFNYSDINQGGKYEIGEVVYYNGHYWRVKVKGWIGTPTEGNNWSRISQPNPSTWNPNSNYSQWAYVTHNNKFYYQRATSYTSNEPGTPGSTWQELTEVWVPTNIYRNASNNSVKQMVYYGGGMYVWNGTDNSNSETAPGTARNGWTELTEVWRYYNDYQVGDRVIYGGAYWEAMQLPYDENDEPIRPGTNFVVWKKYNIVWDPNRG